jgi:hypothetical protein
MAISEFYVIGSYNRVLHLQQEKFSHFMLQTSFTKNWTYGSQCQSSCLTNDTGTRKALASWIDEIKICLVHGWILWCR